MSRYLAFFLAAALSAIAALHIYWGLGGFWPGIDETSLVDMVIGAPAGTPIPPFWACSIVAACLLIPAAAALIISSGRRQNLPSVLRWMPVAALCISALVFIARGLSTYFSPLVLSAKGTAFFELDRTIFAPICLVLGVGLIFVWLTRPKAELSSLKKN